MTGNKEGIQHKYRDLTNFEGKEIMLKRLKSWKEYIIGGLTCKLKIYLMWIKNCGFREKNTDLENIIIEGEGKIIAKLYKVLLEWYAADESVKEQMVKWALNTNTEKTIDQWEYLWKRSIKISTCANFQENCYKLLYR